MRRAEVLVALAAVDLDCRQLVATLSSGACIQRFLLGQTRWQKDWTIVCDCLKS
jgi:hypothetical protein